MEDGRWRLELKIFNNMNRKKVIASILLVHACITVPAQNTGTKTDKAMIVQSKSFQNEGVIPPRFTCLGVNVSPDISWSGIPSRTRSFALICNDPDAPSGSWIHWVLYNIPITITHLPENISLGADVSDQIKPGRNDAGLPGYYGPCPPTGTHRYFFRIYALDVVLKATEGLSAAEVMKLMEGHLLATGVLMGKFTKK
jgi:Raf kinase inhibitor-like YbhB/YbcL family protein